MGRCRRIEVSRIKLFVGVRGGQSWMRRRSWLAKGRIARATMRFLEGARNGLDFLLAGLSRVPLDDIQYFERGVGGRACRTL